MLIVTDLHLTDRAEDEYRWALFPWLAKTLQRGETLLILGDLTDSKDGHSSALVNRIVESIVGLRRRVIILKGNHDYIEADRPFFRFLNYVPHVKFITTPRSLRVEGKQCVFLPHTRTPEKDWEDSDVWDREGHAPDFVFCHQAFDGAEAGNGYRLTTGVSRRWFSDRFGDALSWTGGDTPQVYSGDIHTPQELGDVTYVGTPYPVAFGEDHKPRAIRIRPDGTAGELSIPSIRRLLLTFTADEMGLLGNRIEGLSKGDQAKVTIELRREDFPMWDECRRAVSAAMARQGVQVRSIELREATADPASRPAAPRSGVSSTRTAPQTLRAFCDHRQIPPEDAQVGARILKETDQ